MANGAFIYATKLTGMRILVVEDEREMARCIAQAIEESGMAANIASDGEEALSLAAESSFDLVILDLLLPKRPGASVLKELRRRKPGLPVLILTAIDSVEEKVRNLDLGADDYLTKPFALKELMARIRALLRRRNDRVAAARVLVEDLEVNLATRRVRRGGRELQLTPREYAILVYLVNRRGEVVERREIGEHVIDRVFEPTSNLIDVSIYGLRGKLGQPELIHTVRGMGYRLEATAST